MKEINGRMEYHVNFISEKDIEFYRLAMQVGR